MAKAVPVQVRPSAPSTKTAWHTPSRFFWSVLDQIQHRPYTPAVAEAGYRQSISRANGRIVMAVVSDRSEAPCASTLVHQKSDELQAAVSAKDPAEAGRSRIYGNRVVSPRVFLFDLPNAAVCRKGQRAVQKPFFRLWHRLTQP